LLSFEFGSLTYNHHHHHHHHQQQQQQQQQKPTMGGDNQIQIWTGTADFSTWQWFQKEEECDSSVIITAVQVKAGVFVRGLGGRYQWLSATTGAMVVVVVSVVDNGTVGWNFL
jgi:hypothetical protein